MAAMTEKTFLPVCLDITGTRILVVGGGRVARHKLLALSRYTEAVTILAPECLAELRDIAATWIRKEFEPADLDGFGLVYACTNDRVVNRIVAQAAITRSIPCNVADDPELSSFISPALFRSGIMSVAVSSGGQDVRRSVQWRNLLREVVDDDPSFRD